MAETKIEYNTDRDAAIKRIKTALKRRSGKVWSVTGGRGTAWGWIEINVVPLRRIWQEVQTTTPEKPHPEARYTGAAGITPPYRVSVDAEEPILSPEDDPWAQEAIQQGRTVRYGWEYPDATQSFGHMGPADRLELTELLRLSQAVHYQGHSIPASRDYRIEYIDRAEGREPSQCGERYWD